MLVSENVRASDRKRVKEWVWKSEIRETYYVNKGNQNSERKETEREIRNASESEIKEIVRDREWGTASYI